MYRGLQVKWALGIATIMIVGEDTNEVLIYTEKPNHTKWVTKDEISQYNQGCF